MAYRRLAVVLLIILMLVVSACAFAQDTVQLRMKFSPGELLRYKMVMDGRVNVTGMGSNTPQTVDLPMRMVAVIRERVKRVLPSGDAEINVIVESMKFSFMDKNIQMPTKDAQAVTMVMGTDGQMKSIKGVEKLMGQKPGAMGLLSPGGVGQFGTLPSGELTVGDSWSQSIPFPTGGGNILLIGRLLSANERLGNTTVAVLRQDMSGDLDIGTQMAAMMGGKSPMPSGASAKGKFSGYGNTFFSAARGCIMRTEGALDAQMNFAGPATPSTGGSGRVDMSFSVNYEMYLLPSK